MKILFASSIALSSLLLFAVTAETGDNRYTEDFTSKAYCDTFNTTAVWDTVSGEIKLPPFEITLAGSYDTPGYARGVFVEGDYLYVAGVTAGLQVIDISDPTTPTLAGSYDTPGYAWVVVVEGDYAYVADESWGFQVIDIIDPTTPTLAGTYNTPGSAYGVTVAGDYAYVADWTAGLQVIDISDPTTPSLVATYNTPGNAIGVVTAGDYAYVADYVMGLQVIDISDPTTPSLAGTYDTPGNAWVVRLSGDYLYLADTTPGLHVIDITDPTNPTLAATYNTPGAAYSVAIVGDYAYVADENSGLQLLDISDPTNPSLRLDVVVAGEYAYVADYGSGLQVIDIADAVGPLLAGSYDTPAYAQDVAIDGDYAYVADHTSGLHVLDISDPAMPLLAGYYDTPSYAKGIAVSGNHAFVADGQSGLQVIDISDPTNPSSTGSYDTEAFARDVAVSGDYAYVVDEVYGLEAIDITDPANPSLAGSYNTPESSCYAIAIAGDYAYLADGIQGLAVVDISDPTNPTFVGDYNLPGLVHDVAISGDHVYAAGHNYGLEVIDISDPTNPLSAGSYDTPGYAYGIAVAGDYAYVADDSSGLHVIDISDPNNPSLDSSYDTPGRAYRVTVAGDCAYVADLESGVQVIQVFQRLVDPSTREARSLRVDSSSEDIYAVRLTTTQTDSIGWYVTNYWGGNWTAVYPGTAWNPLPVPLDGLAWHAFHVYSRPFVNPMCSDLVIEWLGVSPIVDTITDIPNDQGKQVSISWTRSGSDYVGSSTPITEYAIYRRIDDALAVAPESEPKLAYPPGDWHFLTTVPARTDDTYATVVPTLADSTISEGMYETVFFVRARTATPGIYFDALPDSGYSVDNLAPTTPQAFSAAYNSGGGTDLAWEECPDADFQYFCVYRGLSDDFTPDPGNLVYTTTSTSWRDEVSEGYKYHYKATSIDFSGNESDPTGPGSSTGTTRDVIPDRFALYQNVPNPFNPSTVIHYDVADAGGRITLQVFDVSGRLVKTLVDEAQSAGRKSVSWDGRNGLGSRAASGVYFYRLEAPGHVETRKMVLLE
jgi:hypothetical protein